jgi:putative transposase
MKRHVKLAPGEYYHIYNRGVEKRIVFTDKSDYDRFLLLLSICNQRVSINVRDFKIKLSLGSTSGKEGKNDTDSLVDIGAYCLMPNHFHILIKEKDDNGITEFMRKITTAYTMYFNKKYKRVGPLFQGSFKSEYIDSDKYLKYLFSYINLNPIKLIQLDWKEEGIKDINHAQNFLKEYNYSSYLEYKNDRNLPHGILRKASFPEYFLSEKDFDNEILDWLNYSSLGPTSGESYPQEN